MPSEPGTATPRRGGLSRRRFCARAGLALLGAAFATVLLPQWRAAARPSELGLREALARCFPHETSARALGRAYLRSHPTEADADLLQLRVRRALGGYVASEPAHRLASRLSARIRRDFEEERLVSVEGWILSETEARAFALLSLV